MVNTQLLDSKIEKSGLKKKFLYETLGISAVSFDKKCKGKIPFRKSEIYVLCHLLQIVEPEESYIFYPGG